jgi:signal transduction histidine kinase
VTPQGDDRAAPPAYSGSVQPTSAIAALAERASPAARSAGRALIQVLAGADPPLRGPGWRSPWQRLAAWTAAGLLLCAASLVGAGGGPSAPGRRHTVNQTIWAGTYLRHLDAIPPALSAALGGPATVLNLVALATVVIPLGLAIRYPLWGWRVSWLALCLVPLLSAYWWGGLPWDPAQILVLLAVACAAGIRHGRAVLCWLWALTLIPWWFWMIRQGPGAAGAALGSAAFLAMAVAVDRVWSERRAQRFLAERTGQAELERARRTVLEERTRIARELHDVVAHHMSLMAIRAESAPHRLGAVPDSGQVRAEFAALSGSAREALADMRRLLGVLRSDEPAARAPQPTLTDLPELIGTARRAGMAVELTAPPSLNLVPPSTGVCAYRIIQEALSNAGQHAAGAPVTVSLHHHADTVVLQVTNGPGVTGRARTNGHRHRPGHGLAGMRERAELLGGSLSADPAPGGGFTVSAALPVTGPTA